MKKILMLLFVTGFCLVGSSQTLPSYLPADSLVAWFPFMGKLDEIAVWNRVLSDNKIMQVFNACKLSANMQPQNDRALLNGRKKMRLLFYPNPAQSILYYTLGSKVMSMGYVIFDATGRILQKNVMDENSNSISIEYLEPGYYFIQINDSKLPVFHFIKI